MSQENVHVVRSIYEAVGRGDVPAVLATFDPNIEWIAAENNPNGAGSPFHGVNEVLEKVFIPLGTQWDGFTITTDELLDAGDKVVMLGTYHGVFKPTGKRIHAQVAHIWTIADGKVTQWRQYTDTYQLTEAAKQPANAVEPA